MKKIISLITVLLMMVLFCSCGSSSEKNPPVSDSSVEDSAAYETAITVPKIDGLSDDFIMGVDISSLLSLEASGRVFYGFDGSEQDIFKTLSQSGVNYIRVRVWNDPFDENGNGYGGGNCTVETAIELGRRAVEYDMGLLVDFHYSDFWADPGKQQAPKAWENMTIEEKTTAIYDFTKESIMRIKQSGVEIGMVQVGNETTGGLCGEKEKEGMYTLMRSAAQAVRDTDGSILIAVHYTNPERKNYTHYAEDLKHYGVDYDIFATSYYPEYHGTLENLKEQLTAVHDISGKRVMIAETSWAYDSSTVGAYKRSVQGQADEIVDCIKTMADLGDAGMGVFYWEPAWIDVPGENWEEIYSKREAYGAGWASSYAGAYDPDDAGKYYGGTACIPTSLFSPDGHPLESLKTFLYVQEGTDSGAVNYILNPSFEDSDYTMWRVTESSDGTVDFQNKESDARDGCMSLHFWNEGAVEFNAEQTVTALPDGSYTFSLCVQGDGEGENATLLIYAVSDGVRYEQSFTLDGWLSWKTPVIENIPCNSGTMTVGIEIKAAPGAWGTVDCIELVEK